MGKLVALALAVLWIGPTAGASTEYSNNQKITRTPIPGEFILSFKTESPATTVSALAGQLHMGMLALSYLEKNDFANILLSRKMMDQSYKTLVVVKKKSIDNYIWSQITNHPQFIKKHPNYLYRGEMREGETYLPNDPEVLQQHHHEVMFNPQSWSLQPQKSIVVAVTDDGVDLDHEDLADNIYYNTSEIPNNGRDDDRNGYVDDYVGWDFASDDNDPRPPMGYKHGTHVAGIIGAVIDNGKGIVGTAAPAVKIMPIRFYGGPYTTEIVAKSYRYAADNGAHILNTSYNIDYFIGDEVFEDAVAYVYQKGLIHFNSAGNGNIPGPRRKSFQELILVCSTIADGKEDDVKSFISNYGEGVDICAPGGGGQAGILSTVPDNQYSRMSGTSMSSPNAAAVAAMIWAHNPHFTRDQVVAQLLGTADSLDLANDEKYHGQLGAGRVNTIRGITEDIGAPQFLKVNEMDENKVVQEGEYQFSVQFTQVLDPASVKAKHFKIFGKNGTIKVRMGRKYLIGSNDVQIRFRGLRPGSYQLEISDKLRNPFGTRLSSNISLPFSVK